MHHKWPKSPELQPVLVEQAPRPLQKAARETQNYDVLLLAQPIMRLKALATILYIYT